MLSGIRLVAVRRLFTDTAAPIPDTISIPYAAAAAEDDADPATPTPSHTDTLDDRRRLNDLEDEVHRYRGLFDDVTGHMASQQAARDNALASSQAQMNQLLAAFAATTAAAQSSQMLAVSSGPKPAVSSGPDYATAAATNGLPYSQQGDCLSADADSTVAPILLLKMEIFLPECPPSHPAKCPPSHPAMIPLRLLLPMLVRLSLALNRGTVLLLMQIAQSAKWKMLLSPMLPQEKAVLPMISKIFSWERIFCLSNSDARHLLHADAIHQLMH